MACAYVPGTGAYVDGILTYVDCQAQIVGEQGYLALAAPGSIASLVLTAMLTILIALFGYRLLLGHVPDLSEGVLTLVKIGIVVALATGWQGYRTLFYDVALHGPAELAAAIGTPSGLPGTGGGLNASLDFVDQQLQQLAVENVSRPISVQPQFAPPPLFAGFDTFALGASRVAFLVGGLGAFAAVRLIAGLLLALGPLFIAFLLFDGTRGLFEGWLRVLAGAALGALATTIVLAIEVALLEPWLADLIARRAGGDPIVGAATQLLAATLVFDIMLSATIGAVTRVAWGFRWSDRRSFSSKRDAVAVRQDRTVQLGSAGTHGASIEGRSRAATLVDAIAASDRREVASVSTGGGAATGAGVTAAAGRQSLVSERQGLRSVAADARRTRPRVSASAGRRDAMR